MTDSREKGARAETAVRDLLRDTTGLMWERTPGSGALDPRHLLKGDLYIPGKDNIYCVEVKHYKEDHFTSSIFTAKNPTLLDWWSQTVRESKQVSRKPLLIFKYDRSKLFCAFNTFPNDEYFYVYVHDAKTEPFYVSLLSDFMLHENPKFIK